jgi:predicted nuclease with TOPRIM domain
VYNIVKQLEKEMKVLNEIIEGLKTENKHLNDKNGKKCNELDDIYEQYEELQAKYDKIYKLMYGRLDTKRGAKN